MLGDLPVPDGAAGLPRAGGASTTPPKARLGSPLFWWWYRPTRTARGIRGPHAVTVRSQAEDSLKGGLAPRERKIRHSSSAAALSCAVGRDHLESHVREVLVEGESCLDAHLAHQSEAHMIHKRDSSARVGEESSHRSLVQVAFNPLDR